MKSETDSDTKQRKLGWRFLIGWTVALLCVFGASTGLVMARQT